MKVVLILLYVGGSRQGVGFEQVEFGGMAQCTVAMEHFETVDSVRAWCIDRETGMVKK